jgi:hypothetical protein
MSTLFFILLALYLVAAFALPFVRIDVPGIVTGFVTVGLATPAVIFRKQSIHDVDQDQQT